MTTVDQRARFRAQGLIRLDRFLPTETVTRGREDVLRRLERQGVWKGGAWHFDRLPPSTMPQPGVSLLRATKRAKVFGELMVPELFAAVADLLDGRPSFPMTDYGQVLFTLPNAASWTVPSTVWHVDIPRLPNRGLPGVQAFTFLDTVAPGGGGTLVVAGSHRLLNTDRRIGSKDLKRHLRREPYFRDLMDATLPDRSRLLDEPGRVGDVEVRVVELTGEPGDVFLADPRLLHTLAPNASKVPRIMWTQRFLLEEMREEFLSGPNAEVPADS